MKTKVTAKRKAGINKIKTAAVTRRGLTTVTQRGQTVVPSLIRERYNVRAGDHLQWIDQGDEIKVVPVPADAVRALRGCARGEGLLNMLLSHRREDKERE